MNMTKRILCGLFCLLLLPVNSISAKETETQTISEEIVAYVNFGSEVESVGMTAMMGEQPEITVSNKMGREGWVLDTKNLQNNAYIYFDVDDEISKDVEDGSSYRVEVDYFDESISSLVLSYDPVKYIEMEKMIYTSDKGGPEEVAPKELEFVEFTETNTWKTYSWFLENPAMMGRLANGADFRIGAYGYVMGYSRGDVPPVVGSVRLIKTNTKSLVRITSETQKTGNNFFDGDKIKFNVHFDNTIYFYQSETIGAYDADVTYTIFDSKGNQYDRKHQTVAIKPSKLVSQEVTFDVDKFDTYSVIIELESERNRIYSCDKTVFAYSKYAGGNQNPRVGIGTAAGIYDNPDGKGISNLIKAAGFGHVRVHNSYVGEVHNSVKDGYDVTNYSWYRQSYADIVKEFRKDGLDLLSYSSYYGNNKLKMGPNDETGSPFTDVGRQNYTNFMEKLIQMFGDSCDTYEIWNEWNGRKNYASTARDIHQDYADLCAYLYPKIKAEYPNVTLFGMVPSNVTTGKEGYEWFEGALKAGAADYMDGVSIHIYQWYGSPITYNKYEELTNAYELLKEYGYEDKPLWITETGYSSNYENVNSEDMQAWYNVQSYIMFQEGDLAERIYLFSAYDSLSNRMRTEREANFGMLEGSQNAKTAVDDGEVPNSAKPAFLAYANMNSLMFDAEYVKKIDFSENTKGYQFKRKETQKDLIALFSNTAQDSVTLDLGTKNVTVYDLYGNKQERVSDNNSFSFNINDAVIYVEGDFEKCVVSDNGQVMPEVACVTSDYNEEHAIKLINQTGKELTAKIKLLNSSAIECDKEFKVPTGGIDFSVKTGNTAVKKYEPLHVTISDGDMIYFDGDIIFNMYQKISMTAETLMGDDDKWRISVSVSNLTDDMESGKVEFVKPVSLASQTREITILPNTTQNVEFVLDDKYTGDDLIAQLSYKSLDSVKNPIYLDQTFTFDYMPKATKVPVIDGDLSDWGKGWIHMDKAENFNQFVGYFTPYHGINDLSADVAMMWDEENYYFAAEVTDDIFYAEGEEPVNIWKLDSIQMALALYPENLTLKSDFEEFALCLLDGKPVVYRHKTKMDTEEPTAIANAELKITQNGNRTYYEFKAPWKDLIPQFKGITPGGDILVSIAINDNDSEGRKGVMLYGSGIDGTKDYTLFKRVYINRK